MTAAPVVTGFSPGMGEPGQQVIVQGSGFGTATRVLFDAALADFAVTADNRLVAMVPDAATTGRIRVIDATGTGSSAIDFLVAPRIQRFDPVRSAVNTTVQVDGFNFVGTTNVQIDGQSAAFVVTAATQIRVTVPAGATNGPIRVTTAAGTATSADSFLVTGPGPIVDSFEPAVGAPGTDIVVRGANLVNVTKVTFNNVTATIFSAPAQNQLNVRVPDTATTGKITVTTAAGSDTSAQDFIVTRAPIIQGFNPQVGRDGFTDVTIHGINFTGITGVGFNGRPVVSGIFSPAQGQILVRVPVGATSGLITVTNQHGFGTSATPFLVTLAPIIDLFSPVLGGPGTPVIISGINLSNGLTFLRFNGVNAAFTVTGQGGTQIRATVPVGAGTGPLTMTNAFGSFITTSNFFVTGSTPYVTALSPDRGARGTALIVSGGNFTSPAAVQFNGISAPTAAVTAPTQIHVNVPPGAKTGPVTITTAAGSSTNGPIFYAPPRLSAFVPSSAVVGQTVVLHGTNLTDASLLRFGSAPATFTVTGPEQITAIVPADAQTGTVTVGAPAGTYKTAANFTVLPRILDFSPLLGPRGTQVTIEGTTLVNVTQVTFNNVNAPFISVSPTEIRATVPNTATTGPIRVITPDGIAISPGVFVVTQDSDLQLIKTVTPSVVQPGDTVLYTLIASNRGPSIVTGVEIRDTLPTGLSFLNATMDRGTWTHTNQVVTGSVGALTNGTAITLAIEAMAQSEGFLTNNAVVTAIEGDPTVVNNHARIRLTVIADESQILTIQRAPTPEGVVLRWPVSPVPLTLQSIPTLSPDSTWSNVTAAPVVQDGFNTMTIQTSNSSRYYRLKGS